MELSKSGPQVTSPSHDHSLDNTNRQPIRLLLLNDHLLLRESLARLLASYPDFELIAECSDPHQALRILKTSKVDVVILDLAIAKDFINGAQKTRYRGKFLAVARDLDATGSAIVLKRGASGVFLESDSSTRLVQAVRFVASGDAWVDRRVIQLLADRYPSYESRWAAQLTERERAVLDRVVNGLSNRKIGVEIGVSEASIKATLQQLFNKAGVRTRSQLVRIALTL